VPFVFDLGNICFDLLLGNPVGCPKRGITDAQPLLSVEIQGVIHEFESKLMCMGHGGKIIHMAFLAGTKIIFKCSPPASHAMALAFNLMGLEWESLVMLSFTDPAVHLVFCPFFSDFQGTV